MKRSVAVGCLVLALFVSLLSSVPVQAQRPDDQQSQVSPGGVKETDATVPDTPARGGNGLSVDDLLPDGAGVTEVQRLIPTEIEPPVFDRDLDVEGPDDREPATVEAKPAKVVRAEPVSTITPPVDKVFESPSPVFDEPATELETVSTPLDPAGEGRSVRFGDSPFGLRTADKIGERASASVGKGRTAQLVPADRELSRALSPFGLVAELKFNGFESRTVPGSIKDLAADAGPGSGWELEVDRDSLGELPVGMADRLAVFVWADCDEAGDCGVVHELDTTFDSDDGVYRAELPAAMIIDSGGPDLGDGTPPQVGAAGGFGGVLGRPVFLQLGGGGSSWWTGVGTTTASAGGSYAANDLASLGTWQVGTHTGHASTAYGIPVPPAVGPVPDVSFSYSSGSVDGMSSATNNQPGMVGIGWDLSQPVIRRATRNCSDGSIDHSGQYAGNLCLPNASWVGGQRVVDSDSGFVLTMSGVGGRLVKNNASGPHPRYLGATYIGYELETKNDLRIWKVQHDDAVHTDPATNAGATGGLMGEWWEITEPDGTLHVFGRNWALKPSGTLTSTPLRQYRTFDDEVELHSVQVAPVMAEGRHNGDPGSQCHDLVCPIEIAWYLDQTIDTSGNTALRGYWAEQNYYLSKSGSSLQHKEYDKWVNPSWIDYGYHWDDYYGASPIGTIRDGGAIPAETADRFRVQFGHKIRNEAEDYGRPASEWYDTPIDLVCQSSGCSHDSPSFFTHHRLATVTTKAQANVAHSFTLANSWPTTPDGSERKLWLDSIQQAGHDGTAMPKISFSTEFLQNRVNPAGTPMSMARIGGIRTELGGDVTFTYGQPYPPSPTPGSACSKDTGTGNGPPNGYIRLPCNMFIADSPGGPVLWNSYVVTKQRMDPRFGQNADYEELTYNYDTAPDWAYSGTWGHTEYDASQCKDGWGCNYWNDYRGHREVSVTNRLGEKTRHFNFTGMWDDRHSVANTGRLGQVAPSDPLVKVTYTNGTQGDNREFLTGIQHSSGTYRANGWTKTDEMTITAMTQSGSFYPTSHRVTNTDSYFRVFDAINNQFDGERRVVTAFDTDTRVSYVHDHGSTATTGDDTTTLYTYPGITNDWIIGLPYLVTTQTGIVTSNPWNYPLSAQGFAFDGQGFGTAPIQGRVTIDYSQRKLDSSGIPMWKETRFTYDERGLTDSAEVVGAGTTSYDYDTTWGYLDEVDGPLSGTGDLIEYQVDERYGVQTSIDPPDIAPTLMTYDPLGRLKTVTLPGATSPSYKFDYDLDQNRNRAAWASTQTLLEASTYTASYSLVDGFGKTIQTQTPTVDGASTVISSTRYGDIGLPHTVFHPSVVASTADGVFKSYTESTTPRTAYTYQASGQTNTDTWNAAGLQASSWQRPEGLESVVSDPNGNVTRARANVFGNTETMTDPATGVTTFYYNERQDVTSIVGPDGANIQTIYTDWNHAPTSTIDPDLGTNTYTYDTAGRPSSRTDARGITTTITYNPASQPLTLKSGSTTALAWAYDPSGRLTSATNHNLNAAGTAQGTITTSYGYDSRNRVKAASWDIPGLAGTQTINYTHRETGALDTITFPPVAGFPNSGGALDYGFNTLGQPTTVTYDTMTPVTTTPVGAASYTPTGELEQLVSGQPTWPVTDKAVFTRLTEYEDWSGRTEQLHAVGLDQDDEVADHLTRLYRGTLNRDPDADGYRYWMTLYATGTPAANIADYMASTSEFTQEWAGYIDTYTSLPIDVSTNTGFVTWAFDHIVSYPPAVRDVPLWVNALDNGTWTRGMIIDFFAGTLSARVNPPVGSTDAQTPPPTSITNSNADVALDLAYTWDDRGNLTALHETSNTVNQWHCMNYDSRDQLDWAFTRADNNCTGVDWNHGPDPYWVDYNYDAGGNITQALGTGTPNGTYTYTGPQPHAVTTAGTNAYAYDAAGNQTTRTTGIGTQTLTYDILNRLQTITGAGPDLNVLYDANGTRVKRTLDSTDTYYLTDTYELTNDGTNTTAAIHPHLASSKLGTVINGTFRSTVGDHLRSSSLDRDVGGVTANQRYTPFGVIRGGANALPNDFTFTGQTDDPGTGLIDYNARHYDPTLGRFTQPDTVLDGLNRYTYVRNNPLKYIDPTGHRSCSLRSLSFDFRSCVERAAGEVSSFVKPATNAVNDFSDQVEADVKGNLTGTIKAIGDPVGTFVGAAGCLSNAITCAVASTADNSTRCIGEGASFGKCAGRVVTVTAETATVVAGANAPSLISRARKLQFLHRINDVPSGLADDIIRRADANLTGSGETVLGHYDDNYIGVAQQRGASYFDIGDTWEGLSRGEQWAANQRVLDAAIANRDRITLATGRPKIRRPSALADEIDYLTSNGYTWLDNFTLVPG